MMGRARRILAWLDLRAWDNWLPLSMVMAFVIAGGLVYAGAISFGPAAVDLERLHILYTEIGIQTTAGIFAIVISLSLVAIQFAAQEYSHRIMEYYIKSTVFWSTIVVYLGVMLAGIVLQAHATEQDDTRVVQLLVMGSGLAIAMIIPHLLVTASYLKPEFIIVKLLRRVDADYLRTAHQARGKQPFPLSPAADRLLPVVELTERSIDRGDLTTARESLRRVHESYVTNGQPLGNEAVDRYYLDHLVRIARKALAQSDEQETANRAVAIIGDIGAAGPAALAVDRLDQLGTLALRRDAEVTVRHGIDGLRRIFDATAADDVRQAVLASYREAGRRLATGDKERVLEHLTVQLAEIAHAAWDARQPDIFRPCLDLLEAAGHDAATGAMLGVVVRVGSAFQQLGVQAVPTDAGAGKEVLLRLLRVERAVDRREREVISVLEFAKGEIERAISAAPAARAPAPPAATQGNVRAAAAQPTEANGDGLDLSGLWDERQDERPTR